MPIYSSSFDYPSGQLSASMQADALGGPGQGGGFDSGGLLSKILAERRRREAMEAAARRQAGNEASRAAGAQERAAFQAQSRARQEAQAPYGAQSGFQEGQRFRNFQDMFRRQDEGRVAQGMQSTDWRRHANTLAAMAAAGLPVVEAKNLSYLQGGEGAVGEAGANLRQQREMDFQQEQGRTSARRQAEALRRF